MGYRICIGVAFLFRLKMSCLEKNKIFNHYCEMKEYMLEVFSVFFLFAGRYSTYLCVVEFGKAYTGLDCVAKFSLSSLLI